MSSLPFDWNRARREFEQYGGAESFRCESCGWQGKIETHTLPICLKCSYSGRCQECGHETFDDERVANKMKCSECAA